MIDVTCQVGSLALRLEIAGFSDFEGPIWESSRWTVE